MGEESRAKAAATDSLISADRRANANQNALEEARTLLEQADRNRRMIEQELADTNESLSDQTCTNQAICGAKMKCEQEMGAMSHHLDEDRKNHERMQGLIDQLQGKIKSYKKQIEEA